MIALLRRMPWRVPWLSTALTLTAFAADRLRLDWAFRRDAVLDGEVLRLVTGHFVHFNGPHLLGDALAFGFWAACIEQRGRLRLLTTVLVTTLGCSLAILLFCPYVSEYRGLSALDCALAAQLIVLGYRDRRVAHDVLGTAVFAAAGMLFFAKTVFEFATGHAVLAPHLGRSVALLPLAHVIGVGCGLLTVGATALRGREPIAYNRAA